MAPHHHLYEAAWGVAALLWSVAGALLLRRRTAGAAPWARLAALVACTVAATILGARAHFVALAPDLLTTLGWRGLVLPLPEAAGLRITGGLVAGALVIAAAGPVATGHALRRAAIADVLVPAAGFAIALGRLGCFADGCCFGVPCAGPWCVDFPAGSPAWWSHVAQGLVASTAAASRPVHPMQLYLGGAGLIASGVSLLAFRRSRLPDGARALLFVVVLSLLRAGIEPLRESSFGTGVAHQPTLNLAVAAIALAGLVRLASAQRAVGRPPSVS